MLILFHNWDPEFVVVASTMFNDISLNKSLAKAKRSFVM